MAVWLNEPADWSEDGADLGFFAEADTDWWNATFYGYTRDSGHFRGHERAGDFSASVRFRAHFEALYDQGGLMVYVNADNWMKAGIEHTDGEPHFSVVVTRGGQSDWSQLPYGEIGPDGLSVRVTRHDEALRVQYTRGNGQWAAARLAFLDMPEKVLVGPMACAPTGKGFRVQFSELEIGAPISRNLHED